MTEEQSREAFRIVCSHWSAYRGTPVRLWFDAQLGEIFGVKVRPSADTADQIYDQIQSCLASPEFKPRALYEKFGIELLATTDDPCDDLAAHQFLRDDPTWHGRVIPTFRPDKYLEPAQPSWNADVDRLAEVSGIDTGDYDGFIAAMESRRAVLQGQWCGFLRPQPPRRPYRRAGDSPRPSAFMHLARKGEVTGVRGDCAASPSGFGDGADGLRRRPGDDAPPWRAAQPPSAHV